MKKLWILFSVLGIIFLDQLSKNFIQSACIEPVSVIGSTVRCIFVWNEGIAFSLPIGAMVTIPLTLFVVLFLLFLLFGKKVGFKGRNILFESHRVGLLDEIAYLLVIAGAIGNLVDRIMYGKVVDFISIGTFPVFNVADSCITIGAILILSRELFRS